MSIVVIPTSYWISVIEIGSRVANSDQEFSLSYGQVSAVHFRTIAVVINTYSTGSSSFCCCSTCLSDYQTITAIRRLVQTFDVGQANHWTPQ